MAQEKKDQFGPVVGYKRGSERADNPLIVAVHARPGRAYAGDDSDTGPWLEVDCEIIAGQFKGRAVIYKYLLKTSDPEFKRVWMQVVGHEPDGSMASFNESLETGTFELELAPEQEESLRVLRFIRRIGAR